MTRGRHRGPTRRPPRAKPETAADRPLDEAEAILRDIEGTGALNEVRALKSIGNKPGEVTFSAQLQGLANFAPIFSAPDFQFGVWRYPPPDILGHSPSALLRTQRRSPRVRAGGL